MSKRGIVTGQSPRDFMSPLGPAAMEWHVLIAGQPTWALRFQKLEEMLLAIADRRSDTVGDVRPELAWTWTWNQLTHYDGAVAVADLADDLGWSRRHLSTQSSRSSGSGPNSWRG
ncbi:MAG: hypothetical protein H0V49_10480 [Nocardioidaceae bacterium]|nr:hypothetical protein [Nocardioidaceae bacterium]